MQPPPEPTELERQVRKLRLEVRKLKWVVVFCTVAICLTLAGGAIGIGSAASVVLLLVCIAWVARLLADGWDAVSMRWQRARWLAERNVPDEPNVKRDESRL